MSPAPVSLHDSPGITNLVLEDARFAYEHTSFSTLNSEGISIAAEVLNDVMIRQEYSPNVWRSEPLHLIPPPWIRSAEDPLARPTLDWIFLVSALNFSFWSEYEGSEKRFAVDWRTSWDPDSPEKSWDGYYSLLAALNRALEEGIPITDPSFYASETSCPDSLIEYVFRKSSESVEDMPLLQERIRVMREVGSILCERFGGSFQEFIVGYIKRFGKERDAIDAVKMVVDTFPAFRDQTTFKGRQIRFWKRPQILIAETWVAFYPVEPGIPHPIFPKGVKGLTMFADYRVPQILNQLQMLSYDEDLIRVLQSHQYVESGSEMEISIRASSILAVEALKTEIIRIRKLEAIENGSTSHPASEITSVILDFFLWDLAKQVERGEVRLRAYTESNPAHRIRCIWY
ncbi:uncharacterized protein EI90DRAFT_3037634 [Cantharellus anzutake]|uniref:uncharacterized protein n=1 Tax=Cantharellus anzutake TaxID=1750568 RepID=UPI0019073521|nr:uncharacterized protein EI90DRAFT_3037634 [Cantharellus anzutake]KAF8339741.1 hypothetical protein EI90DRAFT_3037634 [Cantharellus anzutake]